MPILTSLGGMLARGFGRIKSGRAPVALNNTFTLPNADTKYVVGDTITFSKPANTAAINASNGIYTFPVRNGINFRIKLYGGGGGGQNGEGSVDGSESSLYAGGYNGGGNGAGSAGPGGGGRTDLRYGNPSGVAANNYNTEILVAGGGGGLGTAGSCGGRYYGDSGCSGMCGSYPCDNAGGGGGYYGGCASCGDDTLNGGYGTNYYDNSRLVTLNVNTYYNSNAGGNALLLKLSAFHNYNYLY